MTDLFVLKIRKDVDEDFDKFLTMFNYTSYFKIFNYNFIYPHRCYIYIGPITKEVLNIRIKTLDKEPFKGVYFFTEEYTEKYKKIFDGIRDLV